MVRRTTPELDDAGMVVRVVGPILGPVFVIEQPATASVVSAVAQTVVSTTLLAANPARRAASFMNDSPGFLYLKLGLGALTSSYTVKIGPNGFYEIQHPGVTVDVTGVWGAAGPGFCYVTELT
jgi:hypothetical protein